MRIPEVEAARSFFQDRLYSEALRLLHEAERRVPANRDVLLQIAACYSAMGMPAMAVEYERRAASDDPESPHVWTAMAADLHRMGDLARSEGAYRRALDLDPGLATAAYELARVAALRGNTEAAADALRRALALRPEYATEAKADGALAKLLRDRTLRGRTAKRRRP